jgi:hypothetical protein
LVTVADAYAASELSVSGAATYGGTASLTATLTSRGLPVQNQAVDFTLDGEPVGTATTSGDGVATLDGLDLCGHHVGTFGDVVGAEFAGADIGPYDSIRASSASGDLVVDPAPLTVTVTVTAPSHSLVVAAPLPTLEAAYAGLVCGDTPDTEGLGVTIGVSPWPVSATVPAIYSVTASGITNADYVTTYVDGTLTTHYGVQPLFDPGRDFTGRAAPLKVALVDANGMNLSSPTITVTAVELQGPQGTSTPSAVGGSARAKPSRTTASLRRAAATGTTLTPLV